MNSAASMSIRCCLKKTGQRHCYDIYQHWPPTFLHADVDVNSNSSQYIACIRVSLTRHYTAVIIRIDHTDRLVNFRAGVFGVFWVGFGYISSVLVVTEKKKGKEGGRELFEKWISILILKNSSGVANITAHLSQTPYLNHKRRPKPTCI